MAPDEPAVQSEIAQRTRWFIRLCWFLLPAVGLPSIISELINEGWTANPQSTLEFFTIALAANAVFYSLARVKKGSLTYYRALAGALIIFYITLITVLIFTKGGLESRSVILYIFPILASAPIFGSWAVYASAGAAVILYDAQVALDYFGIIKPLGIEVPSLHSSVAYVVETIAYISSILILSAVIADYITRLLIDKERQALENLAGLNTAQHIAKIGSWEWNFKTHAVAYSKGYYTLLNIKPTDTDTDEYELINFIHPDDRQRAKRAIDNAIKHGKSFRFDARLSLPHTTLKFIHCEGETVLNSSGTVTRLIGTVQDITDAKQLDLAKSDFVAIASHQLRTPATSVKQYIGMLLGGYAGDIPESQKKMLQTAYESNERQIIIVNDLLYVAQLDSGNLRFKPEPTDVVALIQDIAEELTPRYQASAQTIKCNSKYQHFYCRIDPTLIRMVIENLIDNAHKYSGDNQSIRVNFAYRDKKILIAIKDNGVGISPDDMKKLFLKFTRIENTLSTNAGGSGLGLYLADKLVALHGGKIEVSSAKGRGSTFTISLPNTLTSTKNLSKNTHLHTNTRSRK